MVKSEEQRKELNDIINRWSEHTKVVQYLREYDIPNLVSQILDVFYKVTFYCRHKGNYEDGVHIAFKGMDGGDEREISGLYCKDCAEKYKGELGDKISVKEVRLR